MATQNIKYAKKCKKIFFSQIIGGAMAPFGQGVATPMVTQLLTLLKITYISIVAFL